MGVGIVACVLMIFEVVDFANVASELGAYKDLLSRGIGFYLMIISAAGILAAPFVEKFVPKDKFEK